MMDEKLMIFLFSGLGVLIQNILFKKWSDQTKIIELKKTQEKLMKKLKNARKEKDLEKITDITTKLNKLSMNKLQETMNPNFMSSLPLMLIFFYLRSTYENFVMALPFSIPYPRLSPLSVAYKTQLGWLGFYILSVMLWGQLIRKLLRVEI